MVISHWHIRCTCVLCVRDGPGRGGQVSGSNLNEQGCSSCLAPLKRCVARYSVAPRSVGRTQKNSFNWGELFIDKAALSRLVG